LNFFLKEEEDICSMTDVEIDGEIYQCLDTEVFIPKMTSKNTKLLIQLQG
jgi:hypothetical protein